MKSSLDIAKEVIAGKWGIGADRKTKIEKAGYNYEEIQNYVNRMIKTGKPIKEVTINVSGFSGLVVNLEF